MTLDNKVDFTPNRTKIAANGATITPKEGSKGLKSFASALQASITETGTEPDTTSGDGAETAVRPVAAQGASVGAAAVSMPVGDTDYVLAPDGETRLKAHDWKADATDYVEVLRNAESNEAFVTFAQWRVNQAAAQGRDISGSGGEPSNTELYNEWYPAHGQQQLQRFISNRTEGVGYYGMDSDGHWGYYYDQELTQKNPDGSWGNYKASDGGRALFTTDKGYLWPSCAQDESRAGKTVTLVAGAKAFEVRYDDLGYVTAVVNLSKTKGIDGRTLDLPMARSLDDRGVGGQELMRASNGVDYTGPGSGIAFEDVRGADYRDWETVMAQRGRAAVSAAEQARTEQADAGVAAETAQDAAEAVQPAVETEQAAAETAQTTAGTEQAGAETTKTAAETVQTPVDTARSPVGMAEREVPAYTAEQVNEAIRIGNRTPEVLAAYELLFGMPFEEDDDEERA